MALAFAFLVWSLWPNLKQLYAGRHGKPGVVGETSIKD